jgi:hypothetical protein
MASGDGGHARLRFGSRAAGDRLGRSSGSACRRLPARGLRLLAPRPSRRIHPAGTAANAHHRRGQRNLELDAAVMHHEHVVSPSQREHNAGTSRL